MPILSPSPDSPLPDSTEPLSREAEIRLAHRLARGITRFFEDMGCAAIAEFSLANGRRVDVIALDGHGLTTIVEIKSSVQDFRSDEKWQEYLDFCDRFYFAVAPEFPQALLPFEVGLIVADDWHGTILRESPAFTMNGSRRRAQTLRIALTAAQRLRRFTDPRS
jgi:hypothetical protein